MRTDEINDTIDKIILKNKISEIIRNNITIHNEDHNDLMEKCSVWNRKSVIRSFRTHASLYGLIMVDTDESGIAFELYDDKHDTKLKFTKKFIEQNLLDYKNQGKKEMNLEDLFTAYDNLPDGNKDAVNGIKFLYGNVMGYSDYSELHVFHNPPTAFTDNIPTFLSVSDMKTLLLTNEYGENLLKSVSAVSPNGSRMILIKTKDFNYEGNIQDVMKNLNTACKEYYKIYKDKVLDYMTIKAVEYQEQNGNTIRATEFRQEASKHVLNEIGTMRSYLKKNGVLDVLASVNLKLKIKNGS